MALITVESKNNRCFKIIFICIILLVVVYYFIFADSLNLFNSNEGFENLGTQVIKNGNFESINVASGQFNYLDSSTPNGDWVFLKNGNGGAVISHRSSSWKPVNSYSAGKAVFLQNLGSISQTVNLIGGYKYKLSFDWCNRDYNNNSGNKITISIKDLKTNGQNYLISVSYTPTDKSWKPFENKITFNITSSGAYELKFQGTNNEANTDKSTGLDNISLTNDGIISLEGYSIFDEKNNSGATYSNDLSNSITSLDNCKKLCDENTQCGGFVYNFNEGKCWLKKENIFPYGGTLENSPNDFVYVKKNPPMLSTFPVKNDLTYFYDASSYNTSDKTWYNIVDPAVNPIKPVTSTVTKFSYKGTINKPDSLYLTGSNTTNINLGTLVNANGDYTLFTIAKYTNTTTKRGRIFNGDGTSVNWLSGFHGGKSGVSYHGNSKGWITNTSATDTNSINLGNQWILSSDQDSTTVSSKHKYRANLMDLTISTTDKKMDNKAVDLTINSGPYSNEFSDWAVACVIVFNRLLTSTEINQVEQWLYNKYYSLFSFTNVSDNVRVISENVYKNPVFEITPNSAWKNSDPNLKFDSNVKLIWYTQDASTVAAPGTNNVYVANFMREYNNTTGKALDCLMYIAADDLAKLYVNGKQISSTPISGGYNSTVSNPNRRFVIELLPGKNLIEIRVANSTQNVNAAGLVARVVGPDGNTLFGTDKSWFYTLEDTSPAPSTGKIVFKGQHFTQLKSPNGKFIFGVDSANKSIYLSEILTSSTFKNIYNNTFNNTFNTSARIALKDSGSIVLQPTGNKNEEISILSLNKPEVYSMELDDTEGYVKLFDYKKNVVATLFKDFTDKFYYVNKKYETYKDLKINTKSNPDKLSVTSGLVGFYCGDSFINKESKDYNTTKSINTDLWVNIALNNNNYLNSVQVTNGVQTTNTDYIPTKENILNASGVFSNNLKRDIIGDSTYISGNKNSSVNFGLLPDQYTLFTIAKYNGDNKGRIFDGYIPTKIENNTITNPTNTDNWLSGFWSGKSGVAYHNNKQFITSDTKNLGDNWILSVDQDSNLATGKQKYRANRINLTTNNTNLALAGTSRYLVINGSRPETYSDWAVAAVIIYNRLLTDAEIMSVENWLYKSYRDLLYLQLETPKISIEEENYMKKLNDVYVITANSGWTQTLNGQNESSTTKAEWIWFTPNADTSSPASPSENVEFIKTWINNSNTIYAALQVIVDNLASVKVNGVKINQDMVNNNYVKTSEIRTFYITLPKGNNLIEISCVNEGTTDNPAGLMVKVFDTVTNKGIFKTDNTWKYKIISEYPVQKCTSNNTRCVTTLYLGQYLIPGDKLYSSTSTSNYYFTIGSDGSMIIYNGNSIFVSCKPSTITSGFTPLFVLSPDGNLYLYEISSDKKNRKILWSYKTTSTLPVISLVIDSNGILKLNNTGDNVTKVLQDLSNKIKSDEESRQRAYTEEEARLAKKRADDARKAEEARKAYAEEEAKLARKRADDAKRAYAEEEARLAKINADNAKRAYAEEEARLAKINADNAKRAYAEEEARLAKKRADDAKRAYAEEEARLAKKRADDAKRTYAEEEARLAKKRADDAKRTDDAKRAYAEEEARLAKIKADAIAANNLRVRTEEEARLSRERTNTAMRIKAEEEAKLAKEKADKVMREYIQQEERLRKVHADTVAYIKVEEETRLAKKYADDIRYAYVEEEERLTKKRLEEIILNSPGLLEISANGDTGEEEFYVTINNIRYPSANTTYNLKKTFEVFKIPVSSPIDLGNVKITFNNDGRNSNNIDKNIRIQYIYLNKNKQDVKNLLNKSNLNSSNINALKNGNLYWGGTYTFDSTDSLPTKAEEEILLERRKADAKMREEAAIRAYAEQEMIARQKRNTDVSAGNRTEEEQYLGMIQTDEEAYPSINVPSIPRSSNAVIPISEEKVNKIIDETYQKISPENTKLGSIDLIKNIQPSGGREVQIKNTSDVDIFMVNGVFKLKVNIPQMPSFNRGEDYEKVKNRNPNYFYLSVEKLLPNCTIVSPQGTCFGVYIDDKSKCDMEKTTTSLSTNSFRLVLIPEETALDTNSDIGKNTDFTLVKIADKYYLKNVKTGYMPSLLKNDKSYKIYGDIVNDANSNVASSVSQIYNRLCSLNPDGKFVPEPTKAVSKDKTINLSKPGCDFNPDDTIYLTTSNSLLESSPISIMNGKDSKILIQLSRFNSYGQPMESYNLKSCVYDVSKNIGIEQVKSDKFNVTQYINKVCFGSPESDLNRNLNFSVEVMKFPEDYLRKISIYSLY